MEIGSLTVGTSPVKIPIAKPSVLKNGARILGRSANAGNVYVGTSSNVSTTTGALLPKGDPANAVPFTLPLEHFVSIGWTGGIEETHNEIWLVADSAGQVVDWGAA